MCIFGYFFQKEHFQGSSRKRAHQQKTLAGLTTPLLPCSRGNGWQGEKKGNTQIQKFEYLENEKSFLDEIKNIPHSFLRAII